MVDHLSSRTVVVSGHSYHCSINHHVCRYLPNLSMHFLGIIKFTNNNIYTVVIIETFVFQHVAHIYMMITYRIKYVTAYETWKLLLVGSSNHNIHCPATKNMQSFHILYLLIVFAWDFFLSPPY
jgi:hypothetical protein